MKYILAVAMVSVLSVTAATAFEGPGRNNFRGEQVEDFRGRADVVKGMELEVLRLRDRADTIEALIPKVKGFVENLSSKEKFVLGGIARNNDSMPFRRGAESRNSGEKGRPFTEHRKGDGEFRRGQHPGGFEGKPRDRRFDKEDRRHFERGHMKQNFERGKRPHMGFMLQGGENIGHHQKLHNEPDSK